ncbi:MAG: hypothetical protein P8J20_12830 [Novosphingobium sp.]|nr:hypothetical protein [Novosphingobium sp.]
MAFFGMIFSLRLGLIVGLRAAEILVAALVLVAAFGFALVIRATVFDEFTALPTFAAFFVGCGLACAGARFAAAARLGLAGIFRTAGVSDFPTAGSDIAVA